MLLINDIPFYIGKTKNEKQRFMKHKIKYPESSIEVLDEVPTEEWKFWERYYISLYKSWGFILENKRLYGGNGCDSISEKTRKKMSLAVKERWQIGNLKKPSIQVKNKMSISAINRKDDQSKSDETKKKMSESAKKSWETRVKKISKYHHSSKPVLQYNLVGEFVREWNSATDAAKELNLKSPQYIGRCCNGHTSSVYKFIWKYKI